jgi:hypothetical protein
MTMTVKAPAPLKEQNMRRLTTVIVVNFVAYMAFVRGQALVGGDWYATFKAVIDLLPAGLGLVVMSVANGFLDPMTKARLVFWRWAHPLPGSRAFTVHAKRDPRISVPALRAKFGTLPTSEKDQNSLWYKLYKSVESEPAVTHANKEYLFTRDWTALTGMMVVGLGALAFWQATSPTTAMICIGALVAQYLVVRVAALNYGQRLVTSVLAVKSAQEPDKEGL